MQNKGVIEKNIVKKDYIIDKNIDVTKNENWNERIYFHGYNSQYRTILLTAS